MEGRENGMVYMWMGKGVVDLKHASLLLVRITGLVRQG